MKASALAVVAAIGVGITSGATAEVEFETSSILYYGGPYFVAEQGDYHYRSRRRYWGGPYWISCSGYNPPFETYRMSCRRSSIRISIRERSRHVRWRLK
jgi:hypothetical protein